LKPKDETKEKENILDTSAEEKKDEATLEVKKQSSSANKVKKFSKDQVYKLFTTCTLSSPENLNLCPVKNEKYLKDLISKKPRKELETILAKNEDQKFKK
jgi:hypothetical protein